MQPGDIIDIEIADALDVAHGADIVHRDIKPARPTSYCSDCDHLA